MKNAILATASILAMTIATAATADMTGEVSLDFTKNAADDIVVSKGIDLGVSAGELATASVGLTLDGSTLVLDTYAIGTTISGVGLSFGDQGDLLDGFEGKTEVVGGQTLANLNDEGESLQISARGVGVMLGFADIESDVTDLKNVQVAAGTEIGQLGLGAGVDYNLDTEETTLAASAGTTIQTINLGGTMTYGTDTEVMGYELSAGVKDFSLFMNGDKNDMAQNIGAGYYSSLTGGMNFYAEAGFNLDTEEMTPAAGISFSF